MKRFLLSFLFLIHIYIGSNAQIAAWDFTGASSPVTWAATTFNANLISTSGANNVTRGSGAAASAGANSFRTTGFQNNGISTSNTDYFQITLTAATGYKLSLSTIDAKFNGTNTYAASPGVSNQFAYSLDGTTFTLIGSPTITIGQPVTMTQIDLTGISVLQNVNAGVTVTLRYYASGQTSTGGWGFYSASSGTNGLAIGGSLSATAPLGTITTGTVSSPPFILGNCGATASGTVDFTSTGTYNVGNTFSAELSDDIGSFASPVVIGTLSGPSAEGTDPSGTINITIPAGTAGGTGYQIRVVANNPSTSGTSSASFTITQNGLGGCTSSHSDYYQSFQTGNWNTLTTWQSSNDNTNWVSATLVPTYLANTISIRNGHTVTVLLGGSADQLVIQNGGILEHAGGTFTIEDGSGDDIDIQNGGVLLLSTASTSPAFGAGSPTINVATGGIVRVSATGLTGAAGGGTGVNVSNYVYQHQSILEYTPTAAFSTSNVIYFPNVNSTTIPILRTTNSAAINVGASGANTTIINGVFECNGADVNWQLGATKTFRNGIKGSGNVIALASSGMFIINGLTAELGGTGSLITPTTGLQIGSASNNTTVTVTSNKTVTGDISLLSTNNTYVDLGLNNLTVSGTISGGASNAFIRTGGSGHLVLGTVATKTFPIGNTSYNPVIITNGGGINDFYARVETGINNPSVAFPTYGVDRTWYVGATANISGVTMTFQYAAADRGPGLLATDQVEILQSDYTAWSITANTGLNQVGSDPYTVTSTSAMTIASSEVPYAIGKNGGWILPIDCIISTRAQKMNNTGIISWTVNSCAEVTSFEVQRSVNNGSFQTIGTIRPGITETDFSFTDAALGSGRNLYRIKINRFSGATKYSNTVVIIHNSSDILISSLAPNPVHDKATLIVSTGRSTVVDFKLYNMSGHLLKQWQSNIAEGNNIIEMNVSGLSAGMYTLFASNKDVKTVSRFVKQ